MSNLKPGVTESDIDALIDDDYEEERERYRDDAADAEYEESVIEEEWGDD